MNRYVAGLDFVGHKQAMLIGVVVGHFKKTPQRKIWKITSLKILGKIFEKTGKNEEN